MKTTIDSAGRLVVPKELRRQAQVKPGMPLEIRFREGCIEIEPAPLEINLERRGRLVVAVPRESVTPLTNEIVEESRRRLKPAPLFQSGIRS
jgi:AbrB family looped-hinge helix DNA binding protein